MQRRRARHHVPKTTASNMKDGALDQGSIALNSTEDGAHADSQKVYFLRLKIRPPAPDAEKELVIKS